MLETETIEMQKVMQTEMKKDKLDEVNEFSIRAVHQKQLPLGEQVRIEKLRYQEQIVEQRVHLHGQILLMACFAVVRYL